MIGLDETGSFSGANSIGVVVWNSSGNQVGGPDAADGNVIAGNRRGGVFLTNGSDTLIQNNRIGTTARDGSGRTLGNGGSGISLSGSFESSRNRILDNFIGYNGAHGVGVAVGRENAILSNLFVNNGQQRIELSTDGPTANDPGDADAGANDHQNFPVLTAATSDDSGMTVTGTLDTRPGFTYRIEFYSTPGVGLPTGALLGSVNVTPDGSGIATLTADLPAVQVGSQIVATATRLIEAGGGETSEFGAPVAITPAPNTRGPHVVAVYVRGTQWSEAFRSALGAGDAAAYGFAVPAGPEQLAPLPWVNIDQITIRFSEPVAFVGDGLVVRAAVGDGTVPNRYLAAFFSHSDGGRTATWTLQTPIGADRVLLDLPADAVRDAAGSALDGEWDAATDAFPSGNGAPGGDFRFRFNVLPGDADRSGTVLANDFSQVKQKFFATPTSAAYSIYHDVNGSGSILADDFSAVKGRFFNSLPGPSRRPCSASARCVPRSGRRSLMDCSRNGRSCPMPATSICFLISRRRA